MSCGHATTSRGGRGNRVRIGVSSCLLGHEVRFNGGHKRSRYITDTLALHFEFVPLCPEVGIGLGTPRRPIRLVGDHMAPRAVASDDQDTDFTEELRNFAARSAHGLADVSGYIFKSKSPSCGLERVKVYNDKGMPSLTGMGIFADAVTAACPLLPVEEEGRINDPNLRENFITRVYVYHRWQRMLQSAVSPSALVNFHTEHKFLIMAHDEQAVSELGRLVAFAGREPTEALAQGYIGLMMKALRKPAKRSRHLNVMNRLIGFLRQHLDQSDRSELLDVVESYRQGLVPLVVPMTLFSHHFRRNPHPYIQRQHYMAPYPRELMLQNTI